MTAETKVAEDKVEETIEPASTPVDEKPKDTAGLTDAEKQKAREDRFKTGDPADKDRLLARAKRFGVDDPLLESEKKKKRMERFGTTDAESKSDNLTSEEALAKRAAKFGNGIDAPSMGELNSADKRKKRAERFGLVDAALEDEKRAKREARFGTADPKKIEQQKKEAREKRFGTADPAKVEEEKRKAREARFAAK